MAPPIRIRLDYAEPKIREVLDEGDVIEFTRTRLSLARAKGLNRILRSEVFFKPRHRGLFCCSVELDHHGKPQWHQLWMTWKSEEEIDSSLKGQRILIGGIQSFPPPQANRYKKAETSKSKSPETWSHNGMFHGEW